MKRVVFCGDFHCGHAVGLTPPGYQTFPILKPIHEEMWNFFMEGIEALGEIDILVVNGDAVDGKGARSGGVELIYPDMRQQSHMAAEIINRVKAKKTIMTPGTPYHVSSDGGTDFEEFIADLTGAEITDHAFIEINGRVFDVKHKLGSSSVPHGRTSAISKERLWNLLCAEYEQSPKADVIVRSHVHYFGGAFGKDWLGITLPACQGPGSKFGKRQCSGTVDFGFVWFDIEDNGRYGWDHHILTIKSAKDQIIKC